MAATGNWYTFSEVMVPSVQIHDLNPSHWTAKPLLLPLYNGTSSGSAFITQV